MNNAQERSNRAYKRLGSTALTGGLALAVVATAFLAVAVAARVDEGKFWTEVVGGLAMLGVIVGLNAAGFGLLARKGRSIEEAYGLGYDLGYESGYRQAAANAADLVTCRCGDPKCATPPPPRRPLRAANRERA